MKLVALRTLATLGLAAAFGLACDSGEPATTPAATTAAPASVAVQPQVTATNTAGAEAVATKATKTTNTVAPKPTFDPKSITAETPFVGKRIGFAYTSNIMGKLEPCGCKSNPLGGLARKKTALDEQRKKQKWDGELIVDCGDAFSPGTFIRDHEREVVNVTADFLVDSFNAEGMAVLAVGDRDLALGRKKLTELAARAKFPFLSANIVDHTSGKHIFAPHVVVETAGVKVGFTSVISIKNGNNAITNPSNRDGGSFKVTKPVDAVKAAVADLKAAGAELFVLLAHLEEDETQEVLAENPEIRLVLAGQNNHIYNQPKKLGPGIWAQATEKLNHLAVATYHVWKHQGPGGKAENRDKNFGLEDKVVVAQKHIDDLQARLKLLSGGSKASIDSLNLQIGAARGKKRMAELDLEDATPIDYSANFIDFALLPLGDDVKDASDIAQQVAAFRLKYPDIDKLAAPEPPKRKKRKKRRKKRKNR